MTEPTFIEVKCTVCGKPKQLRIDNRTCSAECYKTHSKLRLKEYNHTYFKKRQAAARAEHERIWGE